MAAQRLGALGEDHSGLGAIGDRHEHCCGGAGDFGIEFEMISGKQNRLVRAVERGAQPFGQRHACGSSAKKAWLLQMPGGLLPLASAISASS